ncbi:OmpH family outer membrane protein [Planctomycetaceae bacterium SH139]
MRHFSKLATVVGCLGLMLIPAISAQAQGGGAKPTVIAVVDVARILKEHKGIQAQVKAVEEELASYDKQFKQQQEELKAAVELLKTLQQGSVDYAKQEEKIANADSSLRLQMNRKRKELVDAEARIYYDNYTMISDAVKLIAEHNKIDLVLRYNSEEMALENQESVIRGVMKNIVYHKDSLDITAYVMQVLDQKMASKQPATATR